MPTVNPPTPSGAAWVSLSGAAAYLGVGTKTVRRYIADGQLPAYRLGGRTTIRVKASDLDALLRPIPTAGRVR